MYDWLNATKEDEREAILELNEAEACTSTLAVFSKLVKRIELDPLCCANEADAVVKVEAVASKLVALPAIEEEKVL